VRQTSIYKDKNQPAPSVQDLVGEQLGQLQRALTERRESLLRLDQQRAQLQATILRLEGGVATLQDLLKPRDPHA
jgi:hypothetical protein